MKKSISLEQFADEVSKELHKTFKNQATDLEDKDKAIMLIEAEFITAFVNTVLAEVLRDNPKYELETRDLVSYVTARYAAVKFNILNAVAEGFSKALSQFANRDAMFYCNLEQVDENFLSETDH
jgi:hypothetical protein